MAELEIVDQEGKAVGKAELSQALFDGQVKEHLIHEVVLAQLAGRRAGTHSTKGRSEVSGGGRKPWRQKGTGRARAGTIRSPLWRGGGVIFGPKPRNYGVRVPGKVKKGALKSALNLKLREGELKLVEGLRLPEPKTREMAKILKQLGLGGKTLVLLPEADEGLTRACRNIPGVKTLALVGINVYDLMDHDTVLTTQEVLGALEARLCS